MDKKNYFFNLSTTQPIYVKKSKNKDVFCANFICNNIRMY